MKTKNAWLMITVAFHPVLQFCDTQISKFSLGNLGDFFYQRVVWLVAGRRNQHEFFIGARMSAISLIRSEKDFRAWN
jgi:hypothetical protein